MPGLIPWFAHFLIDPGAASYIDSLISLLNDSMSGSLMDSLIDWSVGGLMDWRIGVW